jgi:glycosyltransferase involved in cell wall biosynthesis
MYNDKKVTVCITSYNRLDLLKQTIDSFIKLNTYPIERIAVIEDSANPAMRDAIIAEYGDKIDLIYNEQSIGQVLSIDKIYKTVNTQYIFHTEDDYQYIGNPNFIKESVELLEERNDIHQVWIRHLENFVCSHGSVENGSAQFEKEILQSTSGIKYRMYKQAYFDLWSGFSWNPGLRRTQDYINMFPEGYAAFITPENKHSGVVIESKCSEHALKQGYRGVFMIDGACNNMGVTRGTYK